MALSVPHGGKLVNRFVEKTEAIALSKKTKEILASWKKDKKVPKELMAGLLNTILTKCNIQALILSQEINLPAPIPLPKVQIAQQSEKNYIG